MLGLFGAYSDCGYRKGGKNIIVVRLFGCGCGCGCRWTYEMGCTVAIELSYEVVVTGQWRLPARMEAGV